MPELKSGRKVGINLSLYIDKLKSPSVDRIHATPGYFNFAIRNSQDLLGHASIMEIDASGAAIDTGYLVRDVGIIDLGWSEDEICELKNWLTTNKRIGPWLSEYYAEAKIVANPVVLINSSAPSSSQSLPPTQIPSEKSSQHKIESFISQFKISCFFHFTDERNLSLIRSEGGILSLRELRSRGIVPPAPGGNEWSHDADIRIGLDSHVHLCFMDKHPMEFFARNEGRIGATRFLEIDPSIIFLEDLLFTSDVSNKSGVHPLTVEEAIGQIDFSVIYGEIKRYDKEAIERKKNARKYELLIPRIVPLSFIRGI